MKGSGRGFTLMEAIIPVILAVLILSLIAPYLTQADSDRQKDLCKSIKYRLYCAVRDCIDNSEGLGGELAPINGTQILRHLEDTGRIEKPQQLSCPGRKENEGEGESCDYDVIITADGDLVGVECIYEPSHNRP